VAAATATTVPGSVKRIFLTCRAFTGDLEHGQAVMGLTQGGSGNYNEPLTISSRAQRQDHSTLLLMPRRTLADCTRRFGAGPVGDSSRVYNTVTIVAGGISGKK